jgi:hypothetical protein
MQKLISIKRALRFSGRDRNFFEAIFANKPTRTDISGAQYDYGFPPPWYGNPENIQMKKRSDGKWRVVWSSSGYNK